MCTVYLYRTYECSKVKWELNYVHMYYVFRYVSMYICREVCMCDPLISPHQYDAIRSKLQKMILNLRLRSQYTQTVHLCIPRPSTSSSQLGSKYHSYNRNT